MSIEQTSSTDPRRKEPESLLVDYSQLALAGEVRTIENVREDMRTIGYESDDPMFEALVLQVWQVYELNKEG